LDGHVPLKKKFVPYYDLVHVMVTRLKTIGERSKKRQTNHDSLSSISVDSIKARFVK